MEKQLKKERKKPIKSKKYIGVYYYPLQNGDKAYSITYKDLLGKKIWTKVGLYSHGIREEYCHIKRSKIINQMKLGEDPTIIKNKRTAKEVITFGMVADEYLIYRENKISAGSFADIKSKYNKHIKPYFENKDIADITKEDIETISSDKKNMLSDTTLNIITKLIGTIFNFAIDERKLKIENPAKKAHVYSIDNERDRHLTKEEIYILLEKTKEKDNMTYIFTLLALTTGGRLNTICNIQKKHINLSKRVIVLKDFKRQKTYRGYIKKEYFELIKNHIKDLKPNDFILGSGDIVKQVQRRLRPILNDLFNQDLEKDDRKNRVVIHSLRHTFASQLIENNVPIFVVQKLMNHSNIKTTMRYVNTDAEFGQNFVDDMF